VISICRFSSLGKFIWGPLPHHILKVLLSGLVLVLVLACHFHVLLLLALIVRRSVNVGWVTNNNVKCY
jgi:hypothetical protein